MKSKHFLVSCILACCLLGCQSIKNHYEGSKTYRVPIEKTLRYQQANVHQQDLLYLDNLCALTVPRADSIFPKTIRTALVDSLMQVFSQPVDELTFHMGLRQYLAGYKNEHTILYEECQLNCVMPVAYLFKNDEWFLFNTITRYDSSLIGQRIVMLNEVPIECVEKKLTRYVSAENEISRRSRIGQPLRLPQVLKSIGVTSQTDSIRITFANNRQVWFRSLTPADTNIVSYLKPEQLNAHPVTRYLPHFYDCKLYPDSNFAYLQLNQFRDKVFMDYGIQQNVPVLLRPLARLAFNRMVSRRADALKGEIDFERPYLRDYLFPLFDSIKQLGIQNLVLDLRNNPGGQSDMISELMYFLTSREDVLDFKLSVSPSEILPFIDNNRYKQLKILYPGCLSSDSLYCIGGLDGDSVYFQKYTNPRSACYIPKCWPVFNGHIYVLANYSSSSSASLLTTLMQDNGLATVIGTSVANNPVGPTMQMKIKLPNSGFTGSVAHVWIERPNVNAGVVQMPDYWVENGVEDYIDRRDRPFEKALELIRNNEVAQKP